jgi:hypothetical protein
MNWVFETYSNVYSTAMLQDVKSVRNFAEAKKSGSKVRGVIARLMGRA